MAKREDDNNVGWRNYLDPKHMFDLLIQCVICKGPFTYDRNCVLQFDFNSEISFYLMFTYQSETGFVLIVVTASFHIPVFFSANSKHIAQGQLANASR